LSWCRYLPPPELSGEGDLTQPVRWHGWLHADSVADI